MGLSEDGKSALRQPRRKESNATNVGKEMPYSCNVSLERSKPQAQGAQVTSAHRWVKDEYIGSTMRQR